MKIYGSRKTQILSLKPSAQLLVKASQFNDSMQALMPIKQIFMKKGWLAFKTHQEANAHWDKATLKRMRWATAHTVFKKND